MTITEQVEHIADHLKEAFKELKKANDATTSDPDEIDTEELNDALSDLEHELKQIDKVL